MPEERPDLLIRGAAVFDGTGASEQQADIAIAGDTILALGDLGAGSAGQVLEAHGLAVAPGFIDVHSHDDLAVLLHPEMAFKVMQGVTTEVVGNCGIGAAPFGAASLMWQAFHPEDRVEPWDGFAGYLERLDESPPSLNVAFQIGHGAVRLEVMGTKRAAPARDELDRMRAVVREGVDAGAVGFSTGLIYDPGRHARPDEIVALASEMTGTGAVYASHMRNEGEGLLDSVRETIAVGEAAGVPVQISHHKASGSQNWGLVRESLRLIVEARSRGLDVTADQYPYTSASTILAAVIETSDVPGKSGGLGRVTADDVVIATAPRHPEWEGKTISEIAPTLGLGPEAAALRIVEEEGAAATVLLRLMSEDDVRTVLAHPTTMIGSDGLPTLRGKPHPRLYGTFPRILGRYVRELGILSLSEAIFRMTGLPARKFRLDGRGVIRPGANADLVIFDPSTIADTATEEDPHQHPAGIAHVLVNGSFVVRDGAHTGARPGRALRRR